jgi:hypothetical protein
MKSADHENFLTIAIPPFIKLSEIPMFRHNMIPDPSSNVIVRKSPLLFTFVISYLCVIFVY